MRKTKFVQVNERLGLAMEKTEFRAPRTPIYELRTGPWQ